MIRLTGGTAKSHVWNQIFANVLQVPIVGVDCEETGAQGVAIAAGIGAGVYKDYEDAFEKAVKVKEPVLPDDSTFPIYEKRYKEWCRLKTCDRADRNCWNSNKRSVRNYRTRRRNSCCSRNDGYTSMPGWCGSNGRGGIYCRCRFLVYQ